jgi:hypothetical protein
MLRLLTPQIDRGMVRSHFSSLGPHQDREGSGLG